MWTSVAQVIMWLNSPSVMVSSSLLLLLWMCLVMFSCCSSLCVFVWVLLNCWLPVLSLPDTGANIKEPRAALWVQTTEIFSRSQSGATEWPNRNLRSHSHHLFIGEMETIEKKQTAIMDRWYIYLSVCRLYSDGVSCWPNTSVFSGSELSEQIKAATKDSHVRAENTELMLSYQRGRVSLRQYQVNHWTDRSQHTNN